MTGVVIGTVPGFADETVGVLRLVGIAASPQMPEFFSPGVVDIFVRRPVS